MEILIKKTSPIPTQAHSDDAGYDIRATSEPNIIGEFIELPLDYGVGVRLYKNIVSVQYKTGLFYSPQGELHYPLGDTIYGSHFANPPEYCRYHTHIMPRSSIWQMQLRLANPPATIDAGYTGELVLNFDYKWQPEDLMLVPQDGINRFFTKINKEKIYKLGDKIAQMVVFPTTFAKFTPVETLPEKVRGEKGFGSSGV